MNSGSVWMMPVYSHQHCAEYEFADHYRSRRPTDDLSGEQIRDYDEVEPSFPGANVRCIGNPRRLGICDVKLALKDGDELGRLDGAPCRIR
jgi:hypothetical protein